MPTIVLFDNLPDVNDWPPHIERISTAVVRHDPNPAAIDIIVRKIKGLLEWGD